jgi:DNA-binding response OmpR family regulator
MRILIVEDEYITALALKTELREAGYEVVGVAAGEGEAVECFRRQRPDFAIVDIHLSQGDGVSAAEKLESIPVLFVTTDSKALTDLTREASAVMLKPFGPEQIVGAVRAVADVAAGKSRPVDIPPRFRFLV